jgi:Mn2+/Fe2+ NRAMP family transporter
MLLLGLTNNKELMGKYRSGWFDNFFGTLALVVMVGAGILMFVS